MIEPLWALLAVASGNDRSAGRRLALQIFAAVGSDFLIMYSVLTALASRQAGIPVGGQETYLFALGIALFYLINLRVNQTMNLRFSEAARSSIDRIVRRLPRLPLLQYEALGRGALITRILGDGNQVASCRQAVFGVLSGGLRLVLGGLFALSISRAASAVAFAGLALIASVAAGQLQVLKAGFARVAADDARMFEMLRVQIDGGVAVKVHRARASALGLAFDSVSQRVRALRVSMFTAFYDRQYAGDALVYAVLGINVFILPVVFDLGSDVMRALNLVTLWLVLGAIKLVTALPRLSSAGSALARLRDLESQLADERIEPPVREADLDGGPFAPFARRGAGERAAAAPLAIEIEGLRFCYPSTSGRPLFPLGPIDVSLRSGELVFISGHNGSGKSTFARLLAGLYQPLAGRVTVNGIVVNRDNLAAYRSLFATIFVDHCLFERTYGLAADAEARAPALLAELGIADKTGVQGGRVTDRDLSTGQKKRLAMVLARLSDKPILLLDEWAADQDPEFRALFYERLLPQLRDEGRLVVVITHDDNYFDRADRRLRFEQGRLSEVSP